MSAELRAGQVASAAGVNLQTLRYYERRGLLGEPNRTLGGHRVYSDRAVTMLRVIKTAQRLGFSLDQVAELLETGRHHHGRRDAGLQSKAKAKIAEVDQKIADLRVIRESLVQALDAGCDDLVACAGSSCCPLPFIELTTTRPGPTHADA
jgi:DNA-binding transcriptional MerR regulator